MPGTFSPPTPVSDPDMHHGTCVTHVPWCMSGSLTSGFHWSRWWGKHSRHSRRMLNPQFCLSRKRPITWANIRQDLWVLPYDMTKRRWVKPRWTRPRCFTHLTLLIWLEWYHSMHPVWTSLLYPLWLVTNPDSKVHGANMGPIWGRQDPGGPHVGPMNFSIWEGIQGI